MIIYKTTCLLDNKIYISQDSKNNPKYYGSGKYLLNNAIKKYGKENFKKEIICECIPKEELDEKEKFWIKELNSKYPNGYNITGGGGDTYNNSSEEVKIRMRTKTIDTCLKISNTLKGKSTWNKGLTKEICESIRIGSEKNKKPRTIEEKKNISKALLSPEINMKLKKPRRPRTEEEKLKISIATKAAMNRTFKLS